MIINKKEKSGRENTALHYALDGKWKSGIVKQLLNLGADLTAENKIGETAISKIPSKILESFLDENCMSSVGFGKWDLRGNRISPDNLMEENDFGTSIADSPVYFKYTFLAPGLEVENRKNKVDDTVYYKDHEKRLVSRTKIIPETKVLTAISESSDPHIRRLVQHPVIKSYSWLKWKMMRPYFNGNIRMRSLLTICVTWFIFSNYGGVVLNQGNFLRILTNDTSEEISENLEFCRDNKFTFNTLWEFSKNRYSSDWYILFLIHAIIQIVGIGLDIKTKITARYVSRKRLVLENSRGFVMVYGMDVTVLWLITIVLIGAEGILWFVISAILFYQCLKECAQIVTSFPDYLFNLENYFDMAQIGSIYFLLYYPNKLLDFHQSINENELVGDCMVKRSLAALTILVTFVRLLTCVAQHPRLERCKIYFTMLYRVTQSFLEFLFWYSAFFLAFGLGFYIIFHNDTKLKVLKNAAGTRMNKSFENRFEELIGKYSVLNESYENGTQKISIIFDSPKENNKENKEETRFDAPFEALMRTTVMFIGEFDFTDLPINGGNISRTLTYMFLLCFIFLMVMVLMNLLNGMAVSDTGQILHESVVLSTVKFIKNLADFESVVLDNYEWQRKYFSAFPIFQHWMKNRITSSGIFLFDSFLVNRDRTLEIALPFELEEKDELPYPVDQTDFKLMQKFKKFMRMSYLKDENFGSILLLKQARKRLLEMDYRKRYKDMDEKEMDQTEHGSEYVGLQRPRRTGSIQKDIDQILNLGLE